MQRAFNWLKGGKSIPDGQDQGYTPQGTGGNPNSTFSNSTGSIPAGSQSPKEQRKAEKQSLTPDTQRRNGPGGGYGSF